MPKATASTSSASATGAPSTLRQSSRKGKAAWRKNIDLSAVEAQMENARAAERAGLAPVDEKTASSSLFVEDRMGDERVAKQVKRGTAKKPLRSLAILQMSQTTGAPAFAGRARKGASADGKAAGKTREGAGRLTPEQRAKRSGMSRKDIEKLRRVAGRDVRGAFGVIEEEERDGEQTQRGPRAVVDDAQYDVWSAATKAAKQSQADDEAQTKPSVRAPSTFLDTRVKDVSLPLPNEGQSYNPSAEAHEALLNKALQEAQTEEEQRAIEQAFMRKWQEGAAAELAKQRSAAGTAGEVEQVLGMQIDLPGESDSDDESNSSEEEVDLATATAAAKKAITVKRKTKQQRARAKRLKEEIRAQEATKAGKRSRAQLEQLRLLKKELSSLDAAKVERMALRKERRQKRLDEKVGMFKLPKREDEVQLGQDLSDSLRGLKPEGNLLRDRLYAFQRRGLAEPKHTTTQGKAPKTRRASSRTKEYETHSYKRFT